MYVIEKYNMRSICILNTTKSKLVPFCALTCTPPEFVGLMFLYILLGYSKLRELRVVNYYVAMRFYLMGLLCVLLVWWMMWGSLNWDILT